MKKNSLNVFERFAQAYFRFVNGEDQRYLVRINGVVVTEVITSKDELKEALDGALSVNDKSDIEVFMIADIDLFEDEVEDEIDEEAAENVSEKESEGETVQEETETAEEARETEEAIGEGNEGAVEAEALVEADEAPKDLPRSKSDKKAAKKAKKARKLAKKAKQALDDEIEVPVEPFDNDFGDEVAEWETPGEVEPEPVAPPKAVEPKKVKKAVGGTQSVQQLDLVTKEVIATFDSVSHAAKATGVNATNISKVANGHRKSTGGFGWKKI